MGAPVPASPGILLTILLFAMSCLWAFPEVAGAKHAGITRHYKFNVRVYTHTHFAHANTQLSI